MHMRTALALLIVLLAACGGAAPPYPGPGPTAASRSPAAATPLPAATAAPLAETPALVLGAQEPAAPPATPAPGQPAGIGEPFELALGEQKTLAGAQLAVRFVAVPEDSRCPADSQCIWAGRIVVSIEVTEGGAAAQSLTLGLPGGITPDAPELQPAGAYTLRLLGVEPYPASSGGAPLPYVATLVVEAR
jgi:hypothetical protein